MAATNLLNHVALLCRSVDRAAEKLEKMGLPVGLKEGWEGEGTAEIYVGSTSSSRGLLLLMEPVKEGAYRRAMEKRGPGLHHIAVDVPNLEIFVSGLSSSGWLLHPKSLESYKKHGPVYLARPGFPALIEIQQREGHEERLAWPTLISQLSIPLPGPSAQRLVTALGIGEVRSANAGADPFLKIGGHEMTIAELAFV